MTYDLIVLGAGSAGYAAALRSSQLGMKVALVDGDKVGGTCLHRGCIPTKSLVQCAKVAHTVRKAEKFGTSASFLGVDMKAVNMFKRDIVNSKWKGLQSLLKSRGIDLYQGFGKLNSENSVQIEHAVDSAITEKSSITGKNILIATGSTPKQIRGLSGRYILDSDSALNLDNLPTSIAIIGGGVIGVEFASIFNHFGVDVTVIEAQKTLVPSEEPSVSKQLERAFRRRGIKLYLDCSVSDVSQTDGVVISLNSKDSVNSCEAVSADLLLVAIGRAPLIEGLGLETIGVKIQDGCIAVDSDLRTNIPNIFAAGDVIGGLQLAHKGYQQGIYFAEQLAGLNPRHVPEDNIPRVVYASPEIASVGYTTSKACDVFGAEEVVTYEYNLAGNAKSCIADAPGSVKVVQRKNKEIIGVHIIGDGAGELIAEAQLIVNWEAYPLDVASIIHPHPTQGEAIGEAMLALAGKPLHGL